MGKLFGMTSTKFAGMVFGGRFRGLLTLVLVVALLLCHGALGAHHQAHQPLPAILNKPPVTPPTSTTGAHPVWEPEDTLRGTREVAQAA